MKFAIAGTLLLAIVVSNAEEAKSSNNSPQLTSSSNDNRQQTKRLAIYGSSDYLQNSGFRPITTSFPSVNNYVGNHQLYSSAASNVYTKTAPSYNNQFLASPAEKYASYRAPPSHHQQYQSYQSHQQYQPLTYTASHQPQTSYSQPQGAFAYTSVSHGPQIYTQQIPFNHYAYNHHQPINPVLHAAPIATFANSYQTPSNTFFANPQQIYKVPFYNQQPQTFNGASSYQPTNYHHHDVKQLSQSSPQSQIITSKPVALEASIATPTPSSLNHVNHNHGAISYAHYSQTQDERKASAASPLIATQTSPQVYYHHQPQQIYSNGDYSKQPIQYAAVPVASSYYPVQQQSSLHYGNVPYAHISKIPFAPPSISTAQKVTFH